MKKEIKILIALIASFAVLGMGLILVMWFVMYTEIRKEAEYTFERAKKELVVGSLYSFEGEDGNFGVCKLEKIIKRGKPPAFLELRFYGNVFDRRPKSLDPEDLEPMSRKGAHALGFARMWPFSGDMSYNFRSFSKKNPKPVTATGNIEAIRGRTTITDCSKEG